MRIKDLLLPFLESRAILSASKATMKNLKSLLQNNIFILLLLVVEIALLITNFKPGTYFLGWDNLFPEINFSENLKRSFFGIWQEYRGLGLLDGMSFAANLPHYIFLNILSFILPQNVLRYFFIFLMHFLGGVGLFTLSNHLFKKYSYNKIASFIASLFYLLNIATIQMFFAPYEVFTVHFAFLPWLLLSAIIYSEDSSRKNLLVFAVFSILSIPQSHVPTLFIVYLLALILVTIKNFKVSTVILLTTIVINAYWLFPYAYSTLQNAEIIKNSKINIMSTEDAYLKNKAFGDLNNVILLKGFMLDYTDLQINNERMMSAWKNHTNSPVFTFLGYLFFSICLYGVFLGIKNKKHLSFIAMFALSFLMLSNNTPILSFVTQFLQKNVPFFQQIFRFTFTKFSILYVFSLSLLISFGLVNLFKYFKYNSEKLSFISTALTVCLISIYSYPSWNANFLYSQLKVNIPQEYFEVVNYFKDKNINERVAILPQADYWGWTYTNWGYHGSGFIWYGIPQATLDGAFLPWSNYNENYYWEISYAIYSKNLPRLENVLEKYHINWILLDENVINPTSPKALLFEDTKAMLANSGKIKLEKEFGNIKIYKVNLETPVKDYLFVSESLPTVGPKYDWNNNDLAYLEKGNYEISDNPKYYYPFRSLFTGRQETKLSINKTSDTIEFVKDIPENYKLVLPKLSELIYVDEKTLTISQNAKVDIEIKNNQISVKFPIIKGLYSGDGQELPNLPHNIGYLISVESKNIKGKSFLFWVENTNIRKSDLEVYLPKYKTLTTSYYILPPMEKDGLGYNLHFDNISIGDEIAINELGKITVNQIPYNFLTNIKLVKDEGEIQPETYAINSTHPNPSLYEININDLKVGESTIVLSQSFNNGWKAYKVNKNISSIFAPLFGEKIKDHVLINNWENGWKVEKGLLEKDQKIVITFLPQYLQYLGFALLALLIPLYRTS